MKFNIVQSTLNSQITYLIHDPIRTLMYSLEALGHDVTFHQNQFLVDRINIVVLGFRMNEKLIDRIIRTKVPYIIYQTEIFSDKGINYIKEWVERESENIHRQNVYLRLLKNALGGVP